MSPGRVVGVRCANLPEGTHQFFVNPAPHWPHLPSVKCLLKATGEPFPHLIVDADVATSACGFPGKDKGLRRFCHQALIIALMPEQYRSISPTQFRIALKRPGSSMSARTSHSRSPTAMDEGGGQGGGLPAHVAQPEIRTLKVPHAINKRVALSHGP